MSLRGLKHRFQRLLAAAVTVTVMVSGAAPRAFAYERPNVAERTSLEIYCHKGNAEFGNVTFKAYKVADMNDLVRFSFSEDFKPYEEAVEIRDDMTNADWVSMADILTGFVERDKVPADRTDATDENGRLKWEDMDTGLYLITGESFARETLADGYRTKIYYKPAPFLIALPSLAEDQWKYDLTVSPKPDASTEGETSRRLLKVWNDSGHESQRPEKLTFDLLQDGEVKETVELTAENNWRYQWDGLDNGSTWRIVEHVTGNYTVSASMEGMTYVVTNTYRNPGSSGSSGGSSGGGGGRRPSGGSSDSGPGVTPPIEGISDPETPLGDMPDTVPEVLISDGDTPRSDWPLLPQTGQLWWPVPVLAAAGMLTFFAGWLLRRKGHEN